MRLLGHPGSDWDETWWKLFPGDSRSFLSSSGSKITAKKQKNVRHNFNRKISRIWLPFFCFLAVILVSELFKKLRETPENNFHQVSSKSEPGCPSNLMLSHVRSRQTASRQTGSRRFVRSWLKILEKFDPRFEFYTKDYPWSRILRSGTLGKPQESGKRRLTG